MSHKRFMRIVGAILFAALIAVPVSLFAGGSAETGSGGQTEQVTEIDVWMINNPVESIIAAFDQAAADFTAETGITVNYVRTPTNEFHTKLVTNVSARQYPDMVIWNINPGLAFSGTGAVASMEDVVDAIGEDRFPSAILRMFQGDGTQYEVPFLSRLSGIHYRKDWLEEAGLNPNPVEDEDGNLVVEALDTWEDVLRTAELISDPATRRYGAGIAFSRNGFGDSAAAAQMVIQSYGGVFLDPETREVSVDSENTIEALAFLQRFYRSDAVPDTVTTWDGGANNLNFLNGTVGIVLNSNSILSRVGTENHDLFDRDVVGIAQPPAGPDGTRILAASPESITVFQTPGEEAAKQFAVHLLRAETQVEMFRTMGVGYYGPLRQDIIDDPFFDTLDEQTRMFTEGNKYIAGLGYPGTPDSRLNQAYNSFVLDDALSRLAVDGWTPERTAAELEANLQSFFE